MSRPALLTALLLACTTPSNPPKGGVKATATAPAAVPAETPAPAVILAMNDTYRAEGIEGDAGDPDGGEGGLARVRALRVQLEKQHPTLLVTHAGDLLYPSFMSRLYGGDQMVDVLNHLDGDAVAADPRLFITFGNHEFDKRTVEDGGALDKRVEGSQFTWLSANVSFALGANAAPIVAAPNLLADKIVESGGYKVGLFGLTAPIAKADYISGYGDIALVARQKSAALRAAGADFVVAITHEDMGQDKALLMSLGTAGPDLIVGGHEHNQQDARVGEAAVVKANADATSVAVVKLQKVNGKTDINWEFIDLKGQSPAPDPVVQALVTGWEKKHDGDFCAKVKEQHGCLSAPIGKSTVRLIAEELEIRRFETNLGDQTADWMLSATAKQGTQVAFINSGSLRLNRVVPAGPVTRQVVEELFAYPSPLTVIQIDGATLQKVAERAVTDWTGQGHFLQIAGFAFGQDPPTGAVTGLSIRDGKGWRAVKPEEKITAVTVDFLLDPKKGQDGYTMLLPSMVRKDPVVDLRIDLKDWFIQQMKAAAEPGISPAVEGRICNAERPGPCLAIGVGLPPAKNLH